MSARSRLSFAIVVLFLELDAMRDLSYRRVVSASGTRRQVMRCGGGRRDERLKRLNVRRVGPLGPDLGVVADLGSLRERLEAAAGDAAVVHEQVLALIVRRDEAEALVVAEPLHGSSSHLLPPGRLCAAERGRCGGNYYERWALIRRAGARHRASSLSNRGQ